MLTIDAHDGVYEIVLFFLFVFMMIWGKRWDYHYHYHSGQVVRYFTNYIESKCHVLVYIWFCLLSIHLTSVPHLFPFLPSLPWEANLRSDTIQASCARWGVVGYSTVFIAGRVGAWGARSSVWINAEERGESVNLRLTVWMRETPKRSTYKVSLGWSLRSQHWDDIPRMVPIF